MYIVYKTTNLVNGKIYIGIHGLDSKKSHSYYLGSGKILKSAIKKYGRINFKRETIFECKTIEEALQYEKEIVNKDFVKNNNNYNVNIGGSSPPSSKLWWTEEHSKKTSERLKNNTFKLGIKESESTKRKKSISMKLSETQGRWKRTEIHKQKQADRAKKQLLAKNPMDNEASRQKVSESKLGRKKMIGLDGSFKYVKPENFNMYLNLNYRFTG